MVHPDHGATHAYDTSQVAQLRVHGWKPEGEDDGHLELLKEPLATEFPGDNPKPVKKGGRPRKVQ